MSEQHRAPGWKALTAVLGAVLVLGALSFVFLGSQVSGVLSTVGSSVGSPGGAAQGGGAGQGGGVGQGGDDGDGGSAGGGSVGGSDGSGGEAGGDSGRVPVLEVSRPDLQVIKTGELTLQVGDIDAALAAVTRAMTALGGYASGTSRSGTDGEASASATFRIPVAAWDDALIAVRGIGGRVLDEHSETEDVTGTVVDLDARVRNLRVTEAALQAIMAKAGAIKDVLAVQGELSEVRGEIEAAQSEASHLRDQAALSTLTVTLGLTPPPVVARQQAQFDPGTEVEAATAKLVSLGQRGVKVGIWFAIVWLPVLAGLGIALVVAYLLARWLRRRTSGELPSSAVSGGGA